jgi:hypothetical protein
MEIGSKLGVPMTAWIEIARLEQGLPVRVEGALDGRRTSLVMANMQDYSLELLPVHASIYHLPRRQQRIRHPRHHLVHAARNGASI